MELSPAGMLVCAAILVCLLGTRGSLLVGLMASLAFGSTAIATLTSLGGSSPLIYTVFCLLLVLSVAVRRGVWQDLGVVLGQSRTVWLVFALMIYAGISALFFPRLFAGRASVFVPTSQGIFEVALSPVSGNITQTGYFLLGAATFVAVCVLLVRGFPLEVVRRGFFIWVFLHAAMGMLDLAGKLVGAGDLLAPIRTASYAMLTQVSQAGFWRIVGAQSEASAFSGISLAGLAFSYTYWRSTGSRLAFGLGMTLLILLLLSTSSTAYVGLGVLSIPVAYSILRSLLARRLSTDEIFLLVAFVFCLVAGMAASLANPGFFDPFLRLLDTAVLEKVSSASGQERAYWNYRSLYSLIDTGGIGIGFGSSRASSWIIAVLSQLGVFGAALMAALVLVLAWEPRGFRASADPETYAVVSSLRACGLAGLLSGSLISGTADPGIVFFVCLAVISITQAQPAQRRLRTAPTARALSAG